MNPTIEQVFQSSAEPQRGASVDQWIDATVATCVAREDSLEDAIDSIAGVVRRVAPTGLLPTSVDWESRWRAYYDFYDHAVARTIRAYVGAAAKLSSHALSPASLAGPEDRGIGYSIRRTAENP